MSASVGDESRISLALSDDEAQPSPSRLSRRGSISNLSDTVPEGSECSDSPQTNSLPITTRTLSHGEGVDESMTISAVVRVRPFSAYKDPEPHDPAILQDPSNPTSTIVVPKELMNHGSGSSNKVKDDVGFQYDNVIWSAGEGDDQLNVFKLVGVPCVNAVSQGFNCCLMAYGQTGSGKSHTIFGPESNPGLTPRCMEMLFEYLEKCSESNEHFHYTVDISVLEIYNEQVTDLIGRREPRHRRTNTDTESLNAFEAFSRHDSNVSRAESGSRTPATRDLDGRESPEENKKPNRRTPSQQNLNAGRSDEEKSRPVSPTKEFPADEGRMRRRASTQFMKPPVDRNEESGKMAASSDALGGTFSSRNIALPDVLADANPLMPKEREVLRVRFHPDIGAYVDGANRVEVVDSLDFRTLMHEALSHRTVASTLMNDQSSRSHAVVQVNLKQEDKIYGTKMTSILNILDLAGSERVSRSGVQGKELKEAMNINKSLTTLRRVIDTLVDKQNKKKGAASAIPPYRDSTLTFLVADSIGGNSKTTMIATVSQHVNDIIDTVSTLRYAQKAQSIKCKVHVNKGKTKVTMQAISTEVERLNTELQSAEARREELLQTTGVRVEKKSNVNRIVKLRINKRRQNHEQLEAVVFETREKHEKTTRQLSFKLAAKEFVEQAMEETDNLLETSALEQSRASEEQEKTDELNKQITEARSELEATTVDPTTGEEMSMEEYYLACRRRRWKAAFLDAAKVQKEINAINELRPHVVETKQEIQRLSDRLTKIDTERETVGFDLALERRRERRFEEEIKDVGDQFQNKNSARVDLEHGVPAVNSEIEAEKAKIAEVERRIAAAEDDHARFVELANGIQENFKQSIERNKGRSEELDIDTNNVQAVMAGQEAGEDELNGEKPKLEKSYVSQKNQGHEAIDTIRTLNQEIDDINTELMDLLLQSSAAEEGLAILNQQLEEAEADCEKQRLVLEHAQQATRETCYPDASPEEFDTKPISEYHMYAIKQTPNRNRHAELAERSISILDRCASVDAAIAFEQESPYSPAMRSPSRIAAGLVPENPSQPASVAQSRRNTRQQNDPFTEEEPAAEQQPDPAPADTKTEDNDAAPAEPTSEQPPAEPEKAEETDAAPAEPTSEQNDAAPAASNKAEESDPAPVEAVEDESSTQFVAEESSAPQPAPEEEESTQFTAEESKAPAPAAEAE